VKSVVCEGAKSLGPRDLWPTGLLLPPGHEPLVHEPLQEGHHPSLPSRPPHPWGRPWGRARPRAQPQCHTPIPTPPPPHHRDVRTTKDTKAGPPEASVPIREIRGSKHLAHPPLFPAGFKPPQQTTDAADNTDTPAHRPPHSPPSHPCPSVKSVVQQHLAHPPPSLTPPAPGPPSGAAPVPGRPPMPYPDPDRLPPITGTSEPRNTQNTRKPALHSHPCPSVKSVVQQHLAHPPSSPLGSSHRSKPRMSRTTRTPHL